MAYKANKFSAPIDVGKIRHYEIADYWTPIRRNEKLQYVLEPGEFYILASKQRVRVPPDFAAEMLPYDLATQEFRVHYAGFFDPGFGYGTQGEVPGTRAVLEVRASQMPILLEDDQFVGRLNYFKMSATPDRVYGGTIRIKKLSTTRPRAQQAVQARRPIHIEFGRSFLTSRKIPLLQGCARQASRRPKRPGK